MRFIAKNLNNPNALQNRQERQIDKMVRCIKFAVIAVVLSFHVVCLSKMQPKSIICGGKPVRKVTKRCYSGCKSSMAFSMSIPLPSTGLKRSPFFSILSKAFSILKSVGFRPFLSSFHSIGIETGAPFLGLKL